MTAADKRESQSSIFTLRVQSCFLSLLSLSPTTTIDHSRSHRTRLYIVCVVFSFLFGIAAFFCRVCHQLPRFVALFPSLSPHFVSSLFLVFFIYLKSASSTSLLGHGRHCRLPRLTPIDVDSGSVSFFRKASPLDHDTPYGILPPPLSSHDAALQTRIGRGVAGVAPHTPPTTPAAPKQDG